MARITPGMVLTGTDVDCAENIEVIITESGTDVITGCGQYEYYRR